jgi:hypothetical protein
MSLFCLALAMCMSACKGGNKQPAPGEVAAVPKPQETWSEEPISTPAQPTLPVKQGAAPLVYMVESASMVRVMDMTNQQELLRLPIQARTLVSVDSSAGIKVGTATMKLGPLPAGHTYGIYLESGQSNVFRRGMVRPGQPGQSGPVTQPGSTP